MQLWLESQFSDHLNKTFKMFGWRKMEKCSQTLHKSNNIWQV